MLTPEKMLAVNDLPLMLTVNQAAPILNVCPRTIVRMCNNGQLKAVKTASAWRINRDALLEYAGLVQAEQL